MNARADIDLVLPCYNPPSGWEEQVATHFREVERLFSPVRFHLFIVSDGSRRGYEPETIDRLRQLIPDVCVVDYKPNRGKGYALREAVKRCTSPCIIYTDYDFPYTNDSFGRMVEALLGGADVVVAPAAKVIRIIYLLSGKCYPNCPTYAIHGSCGSRSRIRKGA